MATPLVWGLALIGSYLVGAIPFGLLVTRWASGVDVRQVGSGNIGATNVRRAAGSKAGALVLVLDLAKAAIPIALATRLAPLDAWIGPACGFAAFVGHCFPIYLRGRGGKGVASAMGVVLILAPAVAALAVAVFAAAVALTRYVSAGSLAAGAAAVIATWVGGFPLPTAVCTTAMVGIVTLRHRENLDRLRRGTEPKR